MFYAYLRFSGKSDRYFNEITGMGLDCMRPGLSCFFCAYYKACKAIMHWYNSLDSDNTKENEE